MGWARPACPCAGSVWLSLPRSEFYELLCTTLTEYNYK
jgi:hypothetical protein